MRARLAVMELLKESPEWRHFFRSLCEESFLALRSQAWQFRDELAQRGYHFPKGSAELEDALFGLARELLPDSPAAQWDEECAYELCKDVHARLGEFFAGLSAAEKEALDLSGMDPWHDRMVDAGVRNDPAAFREALKGWEQAGLKALKSVREDVA